jgi:ApaG protein
MQGQTSPRWPKLGWWVLRGQVVVPASGGNWEFQPRFPLGSGGVRRDYDGMAHAMREFEGLRVRVDEVVYMPGLDAPPDKPHPFVYFISIFNDSPLPVIIRGRKWVVREDGGEVTVVEGDGVVGQTPVIDPGGHFSYNSYHVVSGGALATGAFFGEAAGEWIYTRIPEFRLELPA